MKNKFRSIVILAILFVAFSACKKEESEDRILAYATIIDSTNKILTTDLDGERLYVDENISNVGEWTDGRRVIVDYTILRPHENTSIIKSNYVKVNSVYSILTKNPIKKSFLSTTAREDSIGHDPINLRDIWFANVYMNINFGLYRNNPGVRHFINLVVDDSKSTADDVYVELRHNAYFDLQSISTAGNVSFRISDFVVPPKTTVKIHLSRLTYNGTVTTDTISYNSASNILLSPKTFLRSEIK